MRTSTVRAADRTRMFKFPRAVWLLGFVSLATDAASEAIYPLLPFFLTHVLGATAMSLGIVEGAAEAVNSALKVLSGRWANRLSAKRPLVIAGYAISSAVRPLIALARGWLDVFTLRLVDRMGKGIRGAPRDAMLASFATPATRGRVFGFHRGMDHAGAVIGPLLAAAFLYVYPGQYRTLFALTIVPGAIAVLLLFAVREEGGAAPQSTAPHVLPAMSRLELPPPFRRFLWVLALFTLGNSTDAFLLLKLSDAAGSAQSMPLLWAALHVIKATASIAFGGLSDRIGRRAVIASGWLIYAIVYAGFAVSVSLPALVGWFLAYGLYFGLVEGAEKALVADLAPAAHRGAAFGWLTAVQGIGALAASLLFGFIWTAAGAAAAFTTGAALALAASALLFLAVPHRTQ